jgi:hypothetical protein
MKRKRRFFLFSRPTETAPAPATTERKIHYFDSTLEGTTIDLEKGVIKGVSVITGGVTARGHDLEVDKKTLVQMFECAKGKRIKTKWNHGSGAEAVNGHLTNFRIESNRLRADWKLMKKHPSYEQALELASEMPECVGLSASFAGEPEEKDGRKFARCEELISTDLVADPAANPTGLFSAKGDSKVDSAFSDMADTTEQSNEELLAQLKAQGEQIEELKNFQKQLIEQIEASEDDDDDDDEDEDDLEGEDEGEDEESDAELAEAGPVGAELAAMRRQINNLTAHIQRQEMAAAEDEQQHAFDVIHDKQSLLIQELEDLRIQNGILLEFQEKAQANGGASFSHERDPITNLSANATDFEKRVHELAANGKSRAAANRIAMKENGGRTYKTHLAAKGVMNQMGR